MYICTMQNEQNNTTLTQNGITVVKNYVEKPNDIWAIERHIVEVKKPNGKYETFTGVSKEDVEQYLLSLTK